MRKILLILFAILINVGLSAQNKMVVGDLEPYKSIDDSLRARIVALENEVVLPGPVIDSVVVGPTNPTTVTVFCDQTLYGNVDTVYFDFVFGDVLDDFEDSSLSAATSQTESGQTH